MNTTTKTKHENHNDDEISFAQLFKEGLTKHTFVEFYYDKGYNLLNEQISKTETQPSQYGVFDGCEEMADQIIDLVMTLPDGYGNTFEFNNRFIKTIRLERVYLDNAGYHAAYFPKDSKLVPTDNGDDYYFDPCFIRINTSRKPDEDVNIFVDIVHELIHAYEDYRRHINNSPSMADEFDVTQLHPPTETDHWLKKNTYQLLYHLYRCERNAFFGEMIGEFEQDQKHYYNIDEIVDRLKETDVYKRYQNVFKHADYFLKMKDSDTQKQILNFVAEVSNYKFQTYEDFSNYIRKQVWCAKNKLEKTLPRIAKRYLRYGTPSHAIKPRSNDWSKPEEMKESEQKKLNESHQRWEFVHLIAQPQNIKKKKDRCFIMTEDQVKKLKQTVEMTPDTFNSNIRHFLHSLMSDPVNTQPTPGLKANGLTRGQLLYYLKKFGIIERHDRLNDKDENGNPKTATMKTSFVIKGKVDDEEEYRVPKNNFDRKVEKMRRYIFEKNLPEPAHRKKEGENSNEAYPNPLMYPPTELSEDGGGACTGGATSAASSGALVTKLGEVPISQRGAFRQTVFTEDVIKRIDKLLDEYDCDCLGSKIKFKATNGKEYTSKLSYITGDDTIYHVVDTDNGYTIFKKDPDNDTAEIIKDDLEETTTFDVGDYTFVAPPFKKKKDPAYRRKDGVGGSHSVEIVKENIDNGEFKFNLDSIPLEILRKGYRDLRLTPRFRDFEEESGINEYLKEVINEILPPDEVSSKIQSKYHLPDQFISVQDAYHGIKIYILVATIGKNDDVITKDMHEMGYYLESSQFIGEANGMKFHQMQFLPYSQNQEDVTDKVKNKYNVLYHWSPSENTEKILTNGLIPRHINDVSMYPDRIYLIYGNADQDRIDGLARQLSMANKHQQNKGNYTLFSIDVKNLPENVRLYNDPMCPIGLYCEEPIPAELVKLVKQEQLKEHIQYISESSIQDINEKRKKEDFFEKHGIKVQKIDQTHQVCSIGFSEKEQKWYGWSHRVIYGFGIGSKVKKGDAGYDEHGSEWTAKTLDDAKQMAIDFANSVA